MRNAIDPVTDRQWRALFTSEDARQASVIATCLEAMEYDVELRPDRQLYVVHVPAEDLAPLLEVLDELIAEQEEFDALIERWRHRSGRVERRLLITMIIIVSALAITGAIEL